MMMMAISPETAIRQFEGDADKRRMGVLVLTMVSVKYLFQVLINSNYFFEVEINCKNDHKNLIWKM